MRVDLNNVINCKFGFRLLILNKEPRLLHKIGNNSYINTAIFSKLHHSYTFIQHYIQIITSRLPKLHLILIYFKQDLELWE